MNKKNLEILGLSEGATKEEVDSAYKALREKYLEERFLDGEAGNNAAKMLTKIDLAYQEILAELNESATASDGGASFSRVEELIKSGNLQDAQRELDNFNERPGQWHYLQSVVFYRKQWMNESKKQLEIAIQLEPDNEKYKEAYRKLNERINAPAGGSNGQSGRDYSAYNNVSGNNYQSRYDGQNMDTPPRDEQMGENFCASCLNCCYTYLCISCLCNGCR